MIDCIQTYNVKTTFLKSFHGLNLKDYGLYNLNNKIINCLI